LVGPAFFEGAFPADFEAATLFLGCSEGSVRLRFFCAPGVVKKDDIVATP
jgi:hypothetical protein